MDVLSSGTSADREHRAWAVMHFSGLMKAIHHALQQKDDVAVWICQVIYGRLACPVEVAHQDARAGPSS